MQSQQVSKQRLLTTVSDLLSLIDCAVAVTATRLRLVWVK